MVHSLCHPQNAPQVPRTEQHEKGTNWMGEDEMADETTVVYPPEADVGDMSEHNTDDSFHEFRQQLINHFAL